MEVLFIYLAIALGTSFFCSVAEAVLLSMTPAYLSLAAQERPNLSAKLQALKDDIETPLAAILSLNTIAHTVGAVGVGAQAASVFGDQYVGIASAIMTVLVLVFSEIIPKTLGSYYWRQLAPATAFTLTYLVIVLRPLIKLSKMITVKLVPEGTQEQFSREEFAAMANLGRSEGLLAEPEVRILQNLFKLRDISVAEVMTPISVVFSLPESNTVELFFNKYDEQRFSRIPVYSEDKDQVTGFVLRSDLLVAQARGNFKSELSNYRRNIQVTLDKVSLLSVFERFMSERDHIMFVVDEYGSAKGLIALEDVFETLLGQEIVDENDRAEDMQKVAKRKWRQKARSMLGADARNPEHKTGTPSSTEDKTGS